MIREQVVVLRVTFEWDADTVEPDAPAQWNWPALVDEPGCVVLAAGPVTEITKREQAASLLTDAEIDGIIDAHEVD